MIDTKDWNIDSTLLPSPKRSGWAFDFFSETQDEKYGVFIYCIEEFRMGSYHGLIAIYDNKDNHIPIINPKNTWVSYANEKTFDYAPKSGCLIFKIEAYKKDSGRPNSPFLLIKPKDRLFGFIEWDYTSVYYCFNEVEKGMLILKELRSNELEHHKAPKRENEIFDLNDIDWYDLKKLDNAPEIYLGIDKIFGS